MRTKTMDHSEIARRTPDCIGVETVFWRIYGAVFLRHWRNFWLRATWWGWYKRLRAWVQDYPGIIRRSWWRSKFIDWCEPSSYDCPNCGFDGFDHYEEPWFRCTDGGSYSTSDGTTHWFQGVQTCPRCRWQWDVEDSD